MYPIQPHTNEKSASYTRIVKTRSFFEIALWFVGASFFILTGFALRGFFPAVNSMDSKVLVAGSVVSQTETKPETGVKKARLLEVVKRAADSPASASKAVTLPIKPRIVRVKREVPVSAPVVTLAAEVKPKAAIVPSAQASKPSPSTVLAAASASLPLKPAIKVAPKTVAAKPAVASETKVAAVGGELPTRIVISKIGVDAGIENPIYKDVDTLDDALTRGAVRYPGSAVLGQDGNLLLFGHSSHLKIVYNKAYRSFNDLVNLTQGDEIKVYSNTKAYVYIVKTVTLAKDTEAKVDLGSATPKLTLVTCNNFGSKEDRYIVEAELVTSFDV